MFQDTRYCVVTSEGSRYVYAVDKHLARKIIRDECPGVHIISVELA